MAALKYTLLEITLVRGEENFIANTLVVGEPDIKQLKHFLPENTLKFRYVGEVALGRIIETTPSPTYIIGSLGNQAFMGDNDPPMIAYVSPLAEPDRCLMIINKSKDRPGIVVIDKDFNRIWPPEPKPSAPQQRPGPPSPNPF